MMTLSERILAYERCSTRYTECIDPITRLPKAETMPRAKKFVSLTRRQLLLRVHAYANAHVALSWKGAGDPTGIPEIEAELDRATMGVFDALDNIDQLRAEHAELRRAKRAKCIPCLTCWCQKEGAK